MSTPLRSLRRGTLLCTLVLLATTPLQAADTVDAQTAFERLKALAGTWSATAKGEGAAEAEAAEHTGVVPHEFRVSAAGTVVMETMAAGTDHEMINMYHVDGEDLMVTHYCAGGNQPRMRLDRAQSTDQALVFDFLDATNLDPGQPHIHSIRIELGGDGKVDSAWTGYQDGKPAGVMTFHLARSN